MRYYRRINIDEHGLPRILTLSITARLHPSPENFIDTSYLPTIPLYILPYHAIWVNLNITHYLCIFFHIILTVYLYTAYVFSPYHSYLTNQSRYMLLYHTTWLYTLMPNYNGTISHSGWHWVCISYYTILNGYILYYLYHNTSLIPPHHFTMIDTTIPNYHCISDFNILHGYILPYYAASKYPGIP